MAKQDPEVKGNPFMAEWDESRRRWIVQSASGERRYAVNPADGRCSCGAPHRCWHVSIIPLAEEIASVQAAARSWYAGRPLRELRAEDRRLAAEIDAAEADTGRPAWLARAQYAALSLEILDRLIAAEAAA